MGFYKFTPDEKKSNRQYTSAFEKEVRQSHIWPDPPDQNTIQLENLAGVLFRLKGTQVTKQQFRSARDAEAELARKIKSSRGNEYQRTVHAHCVRDLGYEGDDAVDEFVKDARRFLKQR
jgi:hypothetical protein